MTTLTPLAAQNALQASATHGSTVCQRVEGWFQSMHVKGGHLLERYSGSLSPSPHKCTNLTAILLLDRKWRGHYRVLVCVCNHRVPFDISLLNINKSSSLFWIVLAGLPASPACLKYFAAFRHFLCQLFCLLFCLARATSQNAIVQNHHLNLPYLIPNRSDCKYAWG